MFSYSIFWNHYMDFVFVETFYFYCIIKLNAKRIKPERVCSLFTPIIKFFVYFYRIANRCLSRTKRRRKKIYWLYDCNIIDIVQNKVYDNNNKKTCIFSQLVVKPENQNIESFDICMCINDSIRLNDRNKKNTYIFWLNDTFPLNFFPGCASQN